MNNQPAQLESEETRVSEERSQVLKAELHKLAELCEQRGLVEKAAYIRECAGLIEDNEGSK